MISMNGQVGSGGITGMSSEICWCCRSSILVRSYDISWKVLFFTVSVPARVCGVCSVSGCANKAGLAREVGAGSCLALLIMLDRGDIRLSDSW